MAGGFVDLVVPYRHSRRLMLAGLHRMSLAALLMLVAQYGLGIVLNLYVAVPAADAHAGIMRVIVNGPLTLTLHVLLGLGLVGTAIVLLVRAVALRDRRFAALAAGGLTAIGGAFAAGEIFVHNGQQFASAAMAILTAVALLCYIGTLTLASVTYRHVAPQRRHSTDLAEPDADDTDPWPPDYETDDTDQESTWPPDYDDDESSPTWQHDRADSHPAWRPDRAANSAPPWLQGRNANSAPPWLPGRDPGSAPSWLPDNHDGSGPSRLQGRNADSAPSWLSDNYDRSGPSRLQGRNAGSAPPRLPDNHDRSAPPWLQARAADSAPAWLQDCDTDSGRPWLPDHDDDPGAPWQPDNQADNPDFGLVWQPDNHVDDLDFGLVWTPDPDVSTARAAWPNSGPSWPASPEAR
jgi:hypothetical protein